MTINTQFEHELKKRISEERERLLTALEGGVAVTDYARYQYYLGQLHALKRTSEEFCSDVETILNKR